ncbi:hydantoinase B/oxoprolinase family protein [Futiania mangrovi]|uniref:Hydantoinase B/oxoprolinase family protein n=1 Tax=Futiania mangrovi TaxID=2959716 RepID=A0A9J6PK82_9PROT|nr:hydantoinase B/oxoprolinase family protein [Futiania mangrovii]MCP1336967.1 hydantoinase B/oxoprolinase family protein [Futiania mangrovii]
MSKTLSPIQLGIIWQRLTGLMDEVAQTFVRTSFSVVVRENWDLACSLMDADGRQFAQSSRSIPSFIGTMPRTLKGMLERYPREALEPGDVLISNDPWLGTGHLNDITMVQPIFRDRTLVAFVGSTFHTVDIGGAPSPTAKDAFEEGLCIPVAKIKRRGEENEDVIAFLRENLREPDETLGDIRAQFASYTLAANRLLTLMQEEGIEDLKDVTDEILARSEHSMREAIAAIPDGEFTDTVTSDGFDEELTIRCTVRKQGTEIGVDYTGTSPQVQWPVNSVMNFTFAYSAYALKCALDPTAPNNDGCFRPIDITAPEGCLVNPRRPAPVWARHLSGHYMPFVIYRALSQIVPEKVAAESGSPLWNVYFKGVNRNGRKFVKMFFMSGGYGARPSSDGPSTLSFPSNVANTPVEQFENAVPLVMTEKALIPDSGGAGRFRGGLGQRLTFRSVSPEPLSFVIRHERVKNPPGGLLGGLAGAAGVDLVNGEKIPAKTTQTLKTGDTVTFETPGGGGLYPPETRDPAALARDIEDGLVSAEAARSIYGAAAPAGE